MIEFKQKRISNMSAHLTDDLINREVIVGIRVDQLTEAQLKKVGFDIPLIVGASILPNVHGPISRFNAQGKDIPRRDQPMETLYRDMEFTRTEWHGHERVEVTDFVWIPYKRYPREHIPAPEIRMNIATSADGTQMVVSDYVVCNQANFEKIKHTINLYLELYGYCFLIERNQNPVQMPRLVKLNWNLLPPGEYPWDRIRQQVLEGMTKQAPKALAAALNRFEQINGLNPTFRAIGHGGYKGYVVFGFEDIDRYVLDSQTPNNAIYIFNNEWEVISQLTKAEILQSNLQVARIIHTERWFTELRRILGK